MDTELRVPCILNKSSVTELHLKPCCPNFILGNMESNDFHHIFIHVPVLPLSNVFSPPLPQNSPSFDLLNSVVLLNIDSLIGWSCFLFIIFSCSPLTPLSHFSFPLSYSTLLLSCSIWRFIYLNKLWYKPVDGKKKKDIFRIFNAANDRKSQLSWLIIICIYIRIYFRINYI